MPNTPSISVIVPMRNAESTIQQCLQSIQLQDRADIEVIVVDDDSTDRSAELASCFTNRLISLKNGGSASAARNAGAKHAHGDILIFVDADIVLQNDSISKIVARLHEQETDIVSANYDDEPKVPGFFSQFQSLALAFRHTFLPQYICFVFSSFCAIHKSTFEAIGGFNESMRAYEDVEFGARLTAQGFMSRLDPSIEVTHLKKYTHSSLLRDYMNKAYAAGPFYRSSINNKVARGDKMPLSLKWASIASLAVAGSIFLLPWSRVPLAITVSAYSLLMIPFLVYLFNRKNILFGLKSYFVMFEVFIVSYCALVFGALKGGYR